METSFSGLIQGEGFDKETQFLHIFLHYAWKDSVTSFWKLLIMGVEKALKYLDNDSLLMHLFFVDDMILFGEAFVAQMQVMIPCLNRFCWVRR